MDYELTVAQKSSMGCELKVDHQLATDCVLTAGLHLSIGWQLTVGQRRPMADYLEYQHLEKDGSMVEDFG